MVDKFIDREEELALLNKHFRSRGAELLIIYGRRRVGKTELLKRFGLDKKSIYFLADRRIFKDQIIEMSRIVGIHFNDETLVMRGFEKFEQVLDYLSRHLKHRVVFIIDEFPYLVESGRGVTSIIQKSWDESLRNTKLMLVLCGSSISMMERETMAHRSPLFGRRTGQILVKPLSPADARKFFPNYSAEEAFESYSVLGGVPMYLNQFNSKKLVFDNIRESILRKDSVLYTEPEFLLKEELREPRTYFSILKYLSFGKVRVKELADVMDMERNEVSRYLATLEELRIVERIIPVTEKHPHKSRKGVYLISDPFLNFWFRFVYPNRTELEAGEIDYVINNKIKRNFGQYVGSIYEYAWLKESSRLWRKRLIPFRPVRVGRVSQEVEIDLLAIADRKIAAFEVKWSELSLRDVNRTIKELKGKLRLLGIDKPITVGVIVKSLKEKVPPDIPVVTLDALLE